MYVFYLLYLVTYLARTMFGHYACIPLRLVTYRFLSLPRSQHFYRTTVVETDHVIEGTIASKPLGEVGGQGDI